MFSLELLKSQADLVTHMRIGCYLFCEVLFSSFSQAESILQIYDNWIHAQLPLRIIPSSDKTQQLFKKVNKNSPNPSNK